MWKIVRRELHLLTTERHVILVLLLGAASVYAILIGNLYSEQIVKNIPVAICDLDETFLSRELIKNISETDQVNFTENLSSEVEAEKILENGQAAAVIVIPKNFSRNFYSQKPIEIAFLCDSSNIVQINYLSTPIELVLGNFSAQYNQFAAISNKTPTLLPAPISMSQRMIGNSVRGYLEFYIYGIILMAAQVGITISFGFSIFEDKEKFFSAKIIFVKEIFYLILSLISLIIGTIFLEILFEMPFRAEIWKFLIIGGIFLFAAESLAGILAIIFQKKIYLIQFITFYTLPALLTAGYIWPEVGMTDGIKIFSMLQPVHYALADFRRILLTGIDVECWKHCGILFLVGVVANILICRKKFLFEEKIK